MNVLHEGFDGDPKYAPSDLLQKMVSDGKLGRKSGEGFYSYT
jgi:3-hydroxybutyryl-CoA dehydrogenase